MHDKRPDQEDEPESRELRPVSLALAEALEDDKAEMVQANLAELQAQSSKTLASSISAMVPEYDATLLHVAASAGNLSAVRALIDLGADIEARDETGDTPLQTALSSIYFKPVDAVALLLLAHNANCLEPDRYTLTPLHHAASRGGGMLVDALIRAGADIDFRAGHDGATTPLHAAAEDGNASAARILLAAGADIETADGNGRTALLLAVEHGQREVARVLIDARCKIDCRDDARQTPLHFATRYGEDDLVQDLIAAGATLSASDERGQTPQQILQAFDATDLTGVPQTASPASLDNNTRTAILRTILFQNRPGWEDYAESSFAGMLHEKNCWMANRCARVRAAITGLRNPGYGPLDRAIASAAFTFFADVTNSIAAHQNPNDGFSIQGIDDDVLNEEYWDLRSVLDGYFSWIEKTTD